MKKRLIMVTLVCLMVAICGVNCLAAGSRNGERKKHKDDKDTLAFAGLGDGGAILGASVTVKIDMNEYLKESGNTITYSKRDMYAYATINGNSLGHLECRINNPVHYNDSGSVIKRFTWNSIAGLFPKVDYCRSVENKTSATYMKNNSYYSQASIIVMVDDAFVPTRVFTVKLYL